MTTRLALLGLLLPALAAAQGSSTLTSDREAFTSWLTTSPVSPLAAVAMHRLDGPVTLGPSTADIPLAGFGPATVKPRGASAVLEADGSSRTLPPGRPVALKPWTFQLVSGAGGGVLLVFGPPRGTPPGWYPPSAKFAYTVTLEAPPRAERRRVLALDGIEVEAELAGFIRVPLGPTGARLQVLRMPIPGTEESELQVYFRDGTNGGGTYPAGRFVELEPAGAAGYRLDFNRARNPFCAYSSVYPCPVPWTGNSIPVPIEAGERYQAASSGP